MNLIELVENILADKLKKNTLAVDKMWAIRKEVEPLAKRTGWFESAYDGFSYYAPVPHYRNRLLFKVFVHGDSLYLVTVKGVEEDVNKINHDSLEDIIRRLSFLIADQLSKEGIYRV
jgi:hypothetical protein